MNEKDRKAIERFQSILRIKTISGEEAYKGEIQRFLPALQELYPSLFAALDIERVGEAGILLRWRGREPEKRPVVLMAHHDVVACDEEKWKYPPFEAQIHEGLVWARGSVDTKCIIAAVLEAMEDLHESGFRPQRDIYFASGGDEEIFGGSMPAIVSLLESRGVRPWFVLDEGGAVLDELPMGISGSFAMVGVAEKAYGTLRVKLRERGRDSAASRAAKAAEAVEKNPLPARLSEPVREMLEAFAPRVKKPLGLVFKNLRLFEGAVLKVMEKNSDTAGMIQSAIVLSEINTNTAEKTAEAVFKLRLNPGDDFDTVESHVRAILDSDAEISIEVKSAPVPVTPCDTAAFASIKRTVKAFFGAETAPFVLDGGTDARHFTRICPEVYRLAGVRMSTAMRKSVHHENEHMPVINYMEGIGFYRSLLEKL